MNYILVYRDGLVGEPRSWDSLMWWVERGMKNLPYPLQPAFVIRETLVAPSEHERHERALAAKRPE